MVISLTGLAVVAYGTRTLRSVELRGCLMRLGHARKQELSLAWVQSSAGDGRLYRLPLYVPLGSLRVIAGIEHERDIGSFEEKTPRPLDRGGKTLMSASREEKPT